MEKKSSVSFLPRNEKTSRAAAGLRKGPREKENGWKSGAHRGVRKSHEEWRASVMIERDYQGTQWTGKEREGVRERCKGNKSEGKSTVWRAKKMKKKVAEAELLCVWVLASNSEINWFNQ